VLVLVLVVVLCALSLKVVGAANLRPRNEKMHQ
jgi:hypothetical protein